MILLESYYFEWLGGASLVLARPAEVEVARWIVVLLLPPSSFRLTSFEQVGASNSTHCTGVLALDY